MNNNLRSRFPLKYLAYSFVLITTLFTFLSCENFLQGEDVKEEITKTIEYNNAPSYTINVEALRGTGTVKTPATGEVKQKVTDVFPIRFEPEDSCKFIKWEAKFQSGESAADYVEFEDAQSLETKVTFKKAPSSVIIIQPVCPPRLTYTFDLYDPDDPAKKYPKDSSISFCFNKSIPSSCLDAVGGVLPISQESIVIQNLQPNEGSSALYYKLPEITDEANTNKKNTKLIFRSDSSFGYIPVYNGQRMIAVTIKKDALWYVNEDYLSPIRVYLDSDITRTFYIGDETSAKTVIKYDVKQKDEKAIGVLKVDGDEADNKPHNYSVGKVISLRYQIPEGYAFKQWKFVDSKGNEFGTDDLKLSVAVPDEETSDRLILLTITVDNYMEEPVTVIPEIYDPRTIEFVKPEENSGVYKVENSALTQEKQSNSYAVGKSFSFSYKVADGYYFHDWAFKRIYKDENGNQKEAFVKKEDLDKYGLEISFEADADTKGYDKATRLAQATISIKDYTEDVISITPVCFEHLKVTDFSLDDPDKIYNRDSTIVLTFNKTIVDACKDKIIIRIPGLVEEKTFADYFDSFVLNQNKLTIYAKGGSVDNLLPLGADGTNTISVVANASDLYYEAQTSDGEKVNVSLASNILYSYKINSDTNEKTRITFHNELDTATLRIDDRDQHTVDYSMGKSFVMKYRLSNDYKFLGWIFERTYVGEDGEQVQESYDASSLSKLNLSMKYEDGADVYGFIAGEKEGIAQATILVESYISGEIKISPNVEKIPTGIVILEEYNGRISANNGELDTLNGNKVWRAKSKEGERNVISFSADPAYEFLYWQIYNRNGSLDDEFIEIADKKSENTSYVLKKAPENGSDIQLAIKPVVAERPQILDHTPSSSGTTLLRRDSAIQVIFDYDMDVDSIYYTETELTQLRKLLNLSELEDEIDENNKLLKSAEKEKYYGYVKEGETYYKNISIKNNNNGDIITQHFLEPVFENGRTLSIGVDRQHNNLPPSYIQILVTVGKIEGETGDGFFYKKDDKIVSMSGSEKWIYRVNSDVDDIPPNFDDSATKLNLTVAKDDVSINTSEPEITQSESGLGAINYLLTDSAKDGIPALYLDVAVKDNDSGSGMASSFLVQCDQLYDVDYNHAYGKSYSYVVDYHSSGALGTYDGPLYLQGLEEGTYSLKFKFKDQSGNEIERGNYYFCYDNTAPFVDMPLPIDITDGDEDGQLKLTCKNSWIDDNDNEHQYKDLKETEIKYKIDGDTADYVSITLSPTETEKFISSLEGDKNYNFVITYKDYAGNEKQFVSSSYTMPYTPTDVTLSTEHGTSVIIKGNQPAGAAYSDVRIRYREKTSSNNGIWLTVNAGAPNIEEGMQIANLANGKTYEFEVCSYNSESDKYSIPYKFEGNYPTFDTIPSGVTIIGDTFNENTTIGNVTYCPPESNYTKLKLLCSSDSNFPDDSEKTKILEYTSSQITKDSNGRAEAQFTGLTAGTYYYTKLIAWYGADTTNKVETSTWGPKTTKPNPVTSLSYSRTNDSLTLGWYAPEGNFDSYIIGYREISDIGYTTKSISKEATSYTIDELSGGKSYYAYINAISNSKYSDIVWLNAGSSVQLYPNGVTNITTAKQSSTSIKITWTNPTDIYSKVYLYYSTSESGLSSASAIDVTGSTEKLLTGLSTGQTYYFKLVSYINATLKTESSILNCSTDIDPATLYVESQNSATIRVYWIPPESCDGLRIYRGSSLIKTITSSEMTSYSKSGSYFYWNNTGLTPNTSYSYYIVSYKNVNGSERTATTTTYSARTKADVVTGLSASSLSSSQVKLTWTNPANTNYWNYTYIYKQKSGGSLEYVTYWTGKSTTEYTVSGLEGGTSYTFYVKTTDANGYLNYGSDSYKTIGTWVSTVSNISYTSTQTGITLSWTNPTGLYDGVKVYKKLFTEADSAYTQVGSNITNGSNSLEITGLSASTDYTFKILTYKSSFTDRYTSVNYGTRPNAPYNCTFTSATTNSITFSCTLDKCDGLYLYYKRHADPGYTSTYLCYSSGDNVPYTKTIYGLTAGAKYDMYLSAYNNNINNYADSLPASWVTTPAAPTGVIAKAHEGNTVVSWNNAGGDTNRYKVYYKKNSDTEWTLGDTVTALSCELTDLLPSTKYDFKVVSNYYYYRTRRAKEGGYLYSPYYVAGRYNIDSSDSSTFTFTTPPAPVTNLSIWQDDKMGKVTIKYTPNSSNNSVDIFVNGSPTTWTSSSSPTTYYTFTIPNYQRSKIYTINVRSYHGANPASLSGNNGGENAGNGTWAGETFSKSCTVETSGSWALGINGGNYSNANLVNVTTSTVTINRDDASRSDGGGAFTGSSNKTVTLTPYSIGQYEVIQAIFEDIMGANPSTTKGRLLPVTNVNWYAAIAFCNKLSVIQGLDPCYEISGYTNSDWKTITYANIPTSNNSTWNAAVYHLENNGYHLPTEAQWEFAARGGEQYGTQWSYNYSGSSTATEVGWISSNSGSALHEVGQKSYNRLYLYDMTGNAGEILTDWWNAHTDDNYRNPFVQYNQSTADGPSRTNSYLVVKDTKFDTSYYIRSIGSMYPYNTSSSYGFRLCRNVTYRE